MTVANDQVTVIAEAGVNHNGDIGRALVMVDAAAAAGADAVKFQTFVPQQLATAGVAKADYQRQNEPGDENQLAMLQRLALDFDSHERLVTRCCERDIDFLSSPFDTASTDFLIDRLQLPTIKLGSGELTNAPLLWRVMHADVQLILSTGMATLDEVDQALGVCSLALRDTLPESADQIRAAIDTKALVGRVTLMHCTTEYPCPDEAVNLRAMQTLHEHTGLPVGYSDHTRGIAVSLAAVARGARVIEKHFTLDRGLPGPDHAASLQPDELEELVAGIRTVSAALGSDDKRPSSGELRTADVARKSLVAARPIRCGERFDERNLTAKRPGTGLSPVHYWAVLGRTASRDYAADELIDPSEADDI